MEDLKNEPSFYDGSGELPKSNYTVKEIVVRPQLNGEHMLKYPCFPYMKA